MKKYLDYLSQKSKEFNILLDDSQLEQFKIYYEFLNEYNSHTNLVSSTLIQEVFERHFADSLSLGLLQEKIKTGKIIDIGIGGGFSGVPIAIAFPSSSLVAVDSVAKKTRFIELLSKELGLEKRIMTVNARAEELGQDKKYRETFDLSVTRAVAHLSVISEYCVPLVALNGHFVAYKAKTAKQETSESQNSMNILGAKFFKTQEYSISSEETIQRELLLFEKIIKTPEEYPRQVGIPKKNPL